MYISLHNHSCFSIFDGFSKISDIVTRAKSLGQHSISLTEHGTLSSVIPFYKECRKQGINPIIGNEFYFCPTVTIKERKLYHLIILAKNREGYHNLLKLDTLAYESVYYKARIDIDMLKKYHSGLICLSACMGSIVNTDSGKYWAEEFRNIFKDDFYLEIQANTMPEQIKYNQKIVQMSRDMDIPLVITNDSHYCTKEQAKYHRYWVNLNKGENDYYPTDDFWIMGESDIREHVRYLPTDVVNECISNTERIAKQCQVDITIEGSHFPMFPVADKLEAVKNLCRAGWKQKIVPFVEPENRKKYVDRVKYELDILEKCDYLNYLLITHDILDWCKRNDILTGIGRGSCGGSLVCYLMDITKLDPIAHDLLFERFVNPERVSAADIDNDIEDSRRGDVIEYIKEKYGLVYNIRTFNYLGVKGSIQRAAQVLKIEPKIAIELSKNAETFDDVKGYDDLVDIAKQFEGLLSAYGCHASAVLVFPDDPTNYCSIEKQGDTYVAAYDYHDLEEMQLVKLDILGLRNLTVIHDTIKMINQPIDIYRLPLDDHEVFQQYASGNTTGIFQTESTVMRSYAKQMKVDSFEDIAALISLVRPGPLDSGMAQQYIEGKSGEEIKALHPLLESILGKTFQVLVYQEQVIAIARSLPKYTLGEADVLRRIVGRKELEKIDAAVSEFINRSIEQNIPEDVAKEVGRIIKACGRYIFNKSHGFLYAYTSYITAYLKHHYPIFYMCSLLNSVIDNQEKTVEYIDECKRMKIPILSPSLQRKNCNWEIEGNGLRVALTFLKGVGKNLNTDHVETFEAIIANNPKNITVPLIKSGALDYLGESRSSMLGKLESLQDVLGRISQCEQKIQENQQQLEQAVDPKEIRKYQRQLESWRKKLDEAKNKQVDIKCDNYNETIGEIEVLGFSFNEVPKVKTGVITQIHSKLDKNKHEMGWITLDSPYGSFRCTVFANGWSKVKHKVKQGNKHRFVVGDTGILEELEIDGSVVKTNEWRKWK